MYCRMTYNDEALAWLIKNCGSIVNAMQELINKKSIWLEEI